MATRHERILAASIAWRRPSSARRLRAIHVGRRSANGSVCTTRASRFGARSWRMTTRSLHESSTRHCFRIRGCDDAERMRRLRRTIADAHARPTGTGLCRLTCIVIASDRARPQARAAGRRSRPRPAACRRDEDDRRVAKAFGSCRENVAMFLAFRRTSSSAGLRKRTCRAAHAHFASSCRADDVVALPRGRLLPPSRRSLPHYVFHTPAINSR